jgi:hypothetical protein
VSVVTPPLPIAAAVSALALLTATPAAAQVPSNLEAIELARSRECVDVLGRLEALDVSLAPLAERSRKLLGIADAVALEDDAVVEALDASDPVEAAVRAWFEADAALAARYVDAPSPELQEERAAAREAIKTTITDAIGAVQIEADAVIGATGDLQQQSGRCAGAVLVRSAVVETCGTTSSPVCDAARDSATVNGTYRFVGSPAELWDRHELRAWTAPGPIGVTPAGELGGGRTVGSTRMGNVVVSVSFAPWLQQRSDLSPEAAERVGVLTDSLGFGGEHPDIVYVPSLAIRATLPEALDGESGYLFHFGEPTEADVVWVAAAGSGAPVEGIVPLAPSHLARLQAGEPITLTAIREADDGQTDALYAIELTSLNQSSAVTALLGYMANQLAGDLARLIAPDNS